MPTYCHVKRSVRDWIITASDAPQIIDGYAEAVGMARIKPPMSCLLGDAF
jgi:hypothetical protein